MSSTPSPQRPSTDLAAFAAALGIGSLLILFGHITTQDLASYAVAIAALYGIWNNRERRM
ncbi:MULTISPECIES: hypothetical protein [unclassified Streptomyces]|uniref:hypothetical protein n=1 Tax=unclassified Streptomyces TaxID=2593676 RepID=UPI00109ED367|nr:hypothetical protein [Streptomyces sp. A1136]THA45646.1 hypothetical protein E6R62_35420 [Streptomyces sp. A1136]